MVARQAKTLDAARPGAVARRRKTGQRTVRENIAELCDEGSFVEYGSLVIAARRQRNLFPDTASRCVVMSYDYTVLAGTQGKKNHQKKDRMFKLAERARLPIVFFTEGGGGRPGDTDQVFAGNLHTPAFNMFGKLSGLVPLVGITSGRCFAGNAVILGCCDVVIATANANIGSTGCPPCSVGTFAASAGSAAPSKQAKVPTNSGPFRQLCGSMRRFWCCAAKATASTKWRRCWR